MKVFAEMTQAIRAGNKEAAFKYISKKAREEIEASGQVDHSLNFMAGMNITDGEVKGDIVVLFDRKRTGLKGLETVTSIHPLAPPSAQGGASEAESAAGVATLPWPPPSDEGSGGKGSGKAS